MFLDGGQRSLVAAGTKSFAVRNGVVEARGVDLGIQQGDRLQRGCSNEGLGLAPADSDGDGILDKWEDQKGIDYDGDGAIDLPLPAGLNKTRADILVYTDWGAGAELTESDIDHLVSAFRSNGAEIHIVKGQEVELPDSANNDASDDFASIAELKASHGFMKLSASPLAREAALLVYHYAITSTKGGGKAEIWGDDFVAGNFTGTGSVRAGTFMHELGHNLGLMHGGVKDHTNMEPNHFSVMNYIYQNNWLYYNLDLTYSNGSGSTLEERHLDETVGIRNPTGRSSNLKTIVKGNLQSVGVPIRYRGWWLFNRFKSDVKADINLGIRKPGGFGGDGQHTFSDGDKFSTLDDSDEWTSLRYCFRGAGSFSALGLSANPDEVIDEDPAPIWDPNPMIVVLPDGRAYLVDDVDGDGGFDPEVDGPIVRQEFKLTLPNGDVITLRTDDYGAIIPSDELVATPESGVTVELLGEGWTFGQEPAVVVEEGTGPDGGDPVFGEAPPTTPPSTSVLGPSKDPVSTTTTSAKPGSGPSASEPAPNSNAAPSSSDNAAPSSSDNAAPPVATSKPVAAQPKAPQPKSAPVREAAASPNTDSGPLARTGSSTSLLLGLALAVGLSGVALVAGSRRRRQ